MQTQRGWLFHLIGQKLKNYKNFIFQTNAFKTSARVAADIQKQIRAPFEPPLLDYSPDDTNILRINYVCFCSCLTG